MDKKEKDKNQEELEPVVDNTKEAVMPDESDTETTIEEEPVVEEDPAVNPLLTAVKEYFPDVTEETLQETAVQLINKLGTIQNTLGDVADEYPEFAMMLNDVMKRMPPDEAIARHYGNELTPPEGAPDWDRINQRVGEYNSMKSEKQAKMEQLDKNREISVENAKKFIADTGLEEEEAMKFLDWYDKLHADMFDGLISIENLQALHKGYVHDSKMAEKDETISELSQNKEIADKNKSIESKKKNTEETDGIPKLGTGGGRTPAKKEKSFGASFFEGVV